MDNVIKVDPLLFKAEGKYKNIRHFIESVWQVAKYGYPARKLFVIGVTGTDGKTTTSHLIYHILKKAGIKVALVSTIGAYIGNKEIDTGFHVTTPGARFLQPFIRDIARKGITHFVLEATSHGLDQHRVVGCNFKIAVLTNLTHEHLDYHQDIKGYIKAKTRLFRMSKVSVLNKDDKHWRNFTGLSGKDLFYGLTSRETDINLNSFKGKILIRGDYNVYNVLAAVVVGREMGIEEKIIEEAVRDFELPVGRMEKINTDGKVDVFVDFAHTPHALECALTAARQWTKKRLIVVFGCAGLRDRSKRLLMGRIASRIADKVIVTAEDPRTESLKEICSQIISGMGRNNWQEIDDRKTAIFQAIKMARQGDLVIITGKGHEKSMCFGIVEVPWSDQEVAREAINKFVLRHA